MDDKRISTNGWDIQAGQFYENASNYDVAFLLAPDIPVPSPTGNAIATLVTTLAEGMKFRSLIFSSKPASLKGNTPYQRKYDIAYYSKTLKQNALDKWRILSDRKSVV